MLVRIWDAYALKMKHNHIMMWSGEEKTKYEFEGNHKAFQLLIQSVGGTAFLILMIDVDCFLAWQYLEDCYYAPHQVTDLIQLMVGFNSCSTLERTVADAAE